MFFSAEVAGARHLWRQAFPNGAVERIDLGGATEEEGVAIDPKGEWLITSIGRRQSSLWLHRPDGDVPLSPEGEQFLQPITSADGTRLYFLSRRSAGQPLELKRMDIASRRLESLVPDHEVIDYDVSPDERTIAFTTPGRNGLDVWVASIDRSSAPRLVVANASDVHFGAQDDLVFVVREGTSNYLDRIGLNGTGRTRIDSTPIQDAGALSADRRWAIEVTGPFAFRAFPVYGGAAPRAICADSCSLRWSRNGQWLYVTWSRSDTRERAAAIPLRSGEVFPPSPPATDDPLGAWLKLPGVRPLDSPDVSPGPDPSTYVFRKTTQLTNLFRVPIGRQ
jgi:dipeptidyl aminopeptidase/acylaminoacyl peptidase